MRKGIALLGILSLLGCGPELTNRQAEENEKNTIIDQQKAALDTFEGDFPGYIRDREGKKRPSLLHLRSFVTVATLASRYEKIYIPNLIGTIVVGETKNGTGDTNIVYSFDQGVYDPNRGALLLIGTNRDKMFLTFVELRIEGNKLKGSMVAGPLVSEIEFNRASTK
jgi:hypothetical protein